MPENNSSAPLLGDLAKRIILDAIRSAYDTGYNDSHLAKSVPSDSAPGYEGRNIEADHGGALIARLNQLLTAPQPQVEPAVVDEREAFENWARSTYFAPNLGRIGDGYSEALTVGLWDSWQARASLATTQPATADTGNMVQAPAGEYPALPEVAATIVRQPSKAPFIANVFGISQGVNRLYTEQQMRAFADATHAMRAGEQEPVEYDPAYTNRMIEALYENSDPVSVDAAEEMVKLRDLLRTSPVATQPFQARVHPWMMACFGAEISADRIERNHRFLEEALELVQSCGCTQSEAHQLVDYVYGRPWGEPNQEVGGVMVTLAALCLANDLDMHAAGDTELARIWTTVDAIRAKQAAKPKHSPLPIASHVATQGEQRLIDALQRARDWMDSQADSQSKGNHSSFDMLMLREERDAIDAVLSATTQKDAK